MSMSAVERLLVETSAWYETEQKARQRFQAQLAPDFGLLDYLRRDEMALSEYLALLLNPCAAHGQGDLYLQRFAQLSEVKKRADWLDKQRSLKVDTEYCLPDGRRMDIYLHCPAFGLAIENKPWASDQDLQLHDYAKYLHGQYPNGQWLLIYLCNEGISEQSLPADTPESLSLRVIQLDFYQLAEWLEDCALHTRAPVVKVFVEAMARFVRERINGEMVMENGEALMGLLLGSEKNTRSAFLIAQQMHGLKQRLLDDLIEYIRSQLADLAVAEVYLDDALASGRKRYTGFHILFDSEDSYCLRWAFDGTGHHSLHYGICVLESAARRSSNKARRAEISNSMCKLIGDEGNGNVTWPWWTYDTRIGMGESFPADWDMDPEAWLLLQDRSEYGFAGRVIQLARRVHHAVQQGELDLS